MEENDFKDIFDYKIELHVHLDGSIRPETVLDIANQRGLQTHLPHRTVEELKRDIVIKTPCSLSKLLKSFGYFMPIIAGSREAVYRIAYEFCEDSAKEKAKYVEVRYCPHLLANSIEKLDFALERGNYTPRDVVLTVNEALEAGSRDFNISVKSILCCMTHRPELSEEVARLCNEFKAQGVVGIDIAGEEFVPGTEPDECLHKQAFCYAKNNGIHRTVHAGENGPASAVREALDHMYAERIGHGYHALDDLELYQRILRDGVHLEVCPISSIRTKACPEDIKQHPLLRLVADGANYSINTDDPIVLDNDLIDDYRFVSKMGLSNSQIIQGIFNAARSCFAPENEKKQILKDLVMVYGNNF
ncbi:hypothetical protein ACJMK2_000399 [Sinanodonta woodiana]|uniref:Adenosine deaminase n=1 Tax=Sinanodonta woodiana TaxID=1069815 RepID=A0ABD3XQW1_SINWO